MKRLIFSLLAIGRSAFGQTPTPSDNPVSLPPKSNYKFSIMTELGLTVASTRMPAMWSFFRNNGIKPDFHLDPLLSLGVGARYGRVKAMLQAGYGVDMIHSSDQEATAIARQIDANYSGLLAGFDLVNARNRRLYLNAGLGTLTYEYTVYRQTNQTVSFQNILQADQSGHIPSLRTRNTYLDINLEYTQREKRKQGAATVLRLGYRRGVQAKTWESDAFRLTEAPTDRISQFYFQGSYYFFSNYTKLGRR